MKKKIPPAFLWAVAILLLLAGLIYPALLRAREEARKASCKNNLKNIGLLMKMYAQDYDDIRPDSFKVLFNASVADNCDVFICPSSDKQSGRWADVDEWTDYKFIAGPIVYHEELSSKPIIYCHHCWKSNNGYTNALWGDGHIEWGPLEIREEKKTP